MPALNSTFLILIAVIVLAVALGGVIAFLYVRARRAEEAGGATSAAPVSQKEVLRQKEEQVTKIRQRIEELYQQQQEQRIQHAQLSQQMDDVKLHIETNDRKVDGLRSELHHEIERRNQELDELRHQLAGALDSFWKTHDALPEGPSAGPRMLTAGSPPQAAAPAEPAPIAPVNTDPAPAAPEPADATFVDTTPVAEPEAPASSGLEWQSFDFAADISNADVSGAEVTPEDPTPVDAASFDGPSGDSSTPDAPLPTFASFASLTSTPPPAAPPPATPAPSPSASEPAAPVPSVSAPNAPAPSGPAPSMPAPEPSAPSRPDGADDLTVISGIDEDVQQQLYALDVVKLDQVARWSRTEARRVAQELGLRPQVVMDQWVFEAQSVLFDQYQQQLA
ncbi:MAG: hypothetical protein AAF809_07595 [Bacteroidota bacterium]